MNVHDACFCLIQSYLILYTRDNYYYLKSITLNKISYIRNLIPKDDTNYLKYNYGNKCEKHAHISGV